MPSRDLLHDPRGFCRAYAASAHLQGIVILMSLVATPVLSGGWRLLDWVIGIVFAVIPSALLKLKAGIEKNLLLAVWIARGHAIIFLIVQVSMFVGFTKTHGEGPNGEGAPGAFIVGMVFFAVLFLCPWLLTALRSFGFQRTPSSNVACAAVGSTHRP